MTNMTNMTNIRGSIDSSGYGLDMVKKVQILSLEFKDSYSFLSIAREKYENWSVDQRQTLILDTLKLLDSSCNKGFLTTVDLRKFPVLNKLLPCFIHPGLEEEEFISGRESMESYKWLYNIVLLNLYIFCLETQQNKEFVRLENVENVDKFTDLKSLGRELFGRLDPSIRHHLQKRGVSLKENIYIGFDTEFNKSEVENENVLISAQLAVSTKTYLLIPLNPSYQISALDENTNKLTKLKKSSTVFNYSKIEMSIQICIAEIRKIKYGDYDKTMWILNETLRLIKGLSYFEKEEYIVFSLPRSIIQQYIEFGSSFSLQQVVLIASNFSTPYLNNSKQVIMNLVKDISTNKITFDSGREKFLESVFLKYSDYSEIAKIGEGSNKPPLEKVEVEIRELDEKRLSRKAMTDLISDGLKVSLTNTKTYYLIAHLTPADLSMLSDFNSIKEELSIVNGSFITLGKPLKIYGKNIHIRDTMLLAPGGSKSLASIGKLYGEDFNKISISQNELEDMQGFLQRDKEKFVEYALRDALISLIHACWMEEFNFKIGGMGIPISLSSIGRSYVKAVWKEESYPGYQISNKYILGDNSTSLTPKGLNVIQQIGFVLPYYIANYKGGRNECFMYGIDRDTLWYDYDLVSAYTTVMSMAGHPDYNNCSRLDISQLNLMTKEEILFSYLIIKADFEFPPETKYPSIPCFVDENCTVYPLKGSCILTGSEYLLALSQGCKLSITDIYCTPFNKTEFNEPKPFLAILKLVQEKRREYAKGTISNLMYKEIGNSIYGSVVRGIGDKRKYDIRSKSTIRMMGDDLTNPLIASWTTAFVRSIMGECLQAVQNLGGVVVSVTTDGFITNLENLEDKLSENYLLGEFRKVRKNLSGESIGLEQKNQGQGMLAWSTRGQLGVGSNIIATTGFQHRVYKSKSEMLEGFISTLKTEHKTLEFIQSRLRTASDIYKKGGQVTMEHRDQLFRMHYDNRRVLNWEPTIPSSLEVFIDSIPLKSVDEGKNLRFISRVYKTKLYGKYSNLGVGKLKYAGNKSNEEIIVRNFLKGFLSTPPLFNLSREGFYGYESLIEFIKCYNPSIKLTPDILSHIKKRSEEMKWVPVQKTKESDNFIQYVKERFKDFDVESFIKKTF